MYESAEKYEYTNIEKRLEINHSRSRGHPRSSQCSLRLSEVLLCYMSEASQIEGLLKNLSGEDSYV